MNKLREISLVINEVIEAAHYVRNDPGKCQRLHGHSWTINVTILGNYHPTQGMLVNFRDVKELIRRFDHTCLNDYFKLPTAENLARYFALKILRLDSENIISVKVAVAEKPDNNIAIAIVHNWRFKYEQEIH